MIWIKQQTAESRTMVSLCSFFFYRMDRIHSFEIRHSVFDIRFFKVSFSIKLTAFWASGGADT
jgi:hypothetical protein